MSEANHPTPETQPVGICYCPHGPVGGHMHIGDHLSQQPPEPRMNIEGTKSEALTSKEMTGERLGQLRELAQQALNEPMDSSVPPHERDLVIAAQDLMWLLDHVESPLRRAVRIARGESGPPTEPVGFARETSERPSATPREPPYFVRSYWSPSRQYLISVHAMPDGVISVQDDNGREWEPAGPQENMTAQSPLKAGEKS